jgi:Leucine-rich repeat (LRR) protein
METFEEILPIKVNNNNENPIIDLKQLKLNRLTKQLEKLKSIIEYPRYYLANYFEEIRKQVDLVGTQLTTAEDIILYPVKRKLTENWLLIINRIKSFEEECIKKTMNNKLSTDVYFQYLQVIKQLELKLNKLNELKLEDNYFDELEYDIYNESYNLKRVLFLNRSVVFMCPSETLVEDLFKEMNMDYAIGKLLCLNEYFGRRGLSKLNIKFKLNQNEQKLITNETVKAFILVKFLETNKKSKNTIDTIDIDYKNIIKYDCNSKDLDCIDSESFNDFTNLTEIRLYNNNFKQLASSLFNKNCTNLTSLYLSNNQLTNLSETIFNGLVNLTQIDLKYNKIDYLEPMLFKTCSNLEYIYLTGNKLKRLDPNLFDGLYKLIGIYLSSNKIEQLDPQIFTGLINLKELYLRENRLRHLDPRLFNGLNRLTYLRINNNKLECLDPALFHGLNNLIGVWIEDNRIKQLDYDLFNGLPKLELINLQNNKLFDTDPNLFKGLNKEVNIYCK